MKIDLDGKVIGQSDHPVNYAGFVIHSAVHMAHTARHKVVMHTHTRAGMAVCALKEGLLPISMSATTFHGKLGYHDYEGPSLDLDERGRLLEEPRRQRGHDAAQPRHPDHRTHRCPRRSCGSIASSAPARSRSMPRGAGTLNVLGDNLAGKSGADIDGFSESASGSRRRRSRVRGPDPQARQDRHGLAQLSPIGLTSDISVEIVIPSAARDLCAVAVKGPSLRSG